MSEVKKCPFCGGKWYARCNKCKSYSAPYDTEEQAREAWNRRVRENETD